MSPARILLLVAAVAAALTVTSGPAAAAPQLLVEPVPARAGDTVTVRGSGFALPAPDACEVRVARADGEAPRGVDTSCALDGHVYGQISGEAAGGVPTDTYDVAVCVPDCGDAWGGRDGATLVVREPTDGMAVPAAWPASSAVGLRPNPAGPDDAVAVEVPTLPAYDDSCAIEWDGTAPGGESCTVDGDGGLSGDFEVPAGAEPGEHVLTVCRPDCADHVGGTASARVVVAAAPVRVPDLFGDEIDEAAGRLTPLGLSVSPEEGEGVVVTQDRGPDEEVPRGTVVTVTLAAVPPPVPRGRAAGSRPTTASWNGRSPPPEASCSRGP